MNKTLKNLVFGITLAGVLAKAGCEKETETRDSRLPLVKNNQSLILHPDYLQGRTVLGYTLLTDVDRSGNWDVAEKMDIGFTPGSYSRTLYCKEGFGPGRSVDAKVEMVEPEFFKPYQ
ncbi:MAG TPA: hypothetical protein VJK07_04195 [Candidatus Nanoarchaeia archaeon]|nr:hypothetical protein [Candidatus Nanoarchaeia archaeon]